MFVLPIRPRFIVSVICSLVVCSLVACSSGGADDLDPSTPVTCKVPHLLCNGRCIDPGTDSQYCGARGSCQGPAAGAVCTRPNMCRDGFCSPDCAAGNIKCGGACVDPRTDPTYCGASGDCTGASVGVTCRPSISRCAAMMGSACQGGQCSGDCAKGSKVFAVTGTVEKFILPACVTEISVKAFGAQGGNSTNGSQGGRGAGVEGSICVPGGSTLTIVVGEQAPAAQYPCGGGGGSYVALGNMPLFVAGGGGGGYHVNGPGGSATVLSTGGPGAGGTSTDQAGGGGGFTTDGEVPMKGGGGSFLGGAKAGLPQPMNGTFLSGGGFGGGGGASWAMSFNTGGGGGYDGGNAGWIERSAGGTSFMAPSAVQTKFTPATHTGHGSIEISYW